MFGAWIVCRLRVKKGWKGLERVNLLLPTK
jgi:hypothetical protein